MSYAEIIFQKISAQLFAENLPYKLEESINYDDEAKEDSPECINEDIDSTKVREAIFNVKGLDKAQIYSGYIQLKNAIKLRYPTSRAFYTNETSQS